MKRIVIVIEIVCVLFFAIAYLQFPAFIVIILPVLIGTHFVTLVGLPAVFKKLKTDAQEELLQFTPHEEYTKPQTEIDLWDRSVVGFYVVTNGVVVVSFFIGLYF